MGIRHESEHPASATELGMRLSLKETRAPVIKSLAETYKKTRSIAKTAEAFGVASRTLDRMIAKVPELSAAFEAVRFAFEAKHGKEWANAARGEEA